MTTVFLWRNRTLAFWGFAGNCDFIIFLAQMSKGLLRKWSGIYHIMSGSKAQPHVDSFVVQSYFCCLQALKYQWIWSPQFQLHHEMPPAFMISSFPCTEVCSSRGTDNVIQFTEIGKLIGLITVLSSQCDSKYRNSHFKIVNYCLCERFHFFLSLQCLSVCDICFTGVNS